ncbi:hypothetical protein [Methanomethylophilus alvi]|jgi:hypothetical protein|uniref:hypothetical protein n=1 Tax=Methanomethylophilus alvi TaxID=1291540 RepID=UPI0011CBF608|nr:hypothetical protein [Methanomethylophilus alvi]
MCQTCGVFVSACIAYGQYASFHGQDVFLGREYVPSSDVHLVQIGVPEAVDGRRGLDGMVTHAAIGLVFHHLGHRYGHRRHQDEPAHHQRDTGHRELHHTYVTFTP